MKVFCKHLLVLSVFVIVAGRSGLAQQQNVMPYMQSPTAAGLGTFGNVDITPFTGLPNIKVPVFSTHEGDIPINCELRYMGGGVKPSAHPGWVGLNWSLSVGGVVTRKVNGGVDEVANSQAQLANNPSLLNIWAYMYNYSVLNVSNWATNAFCQGYWENSSTDGNSSDFTKESYPAPDEFAFVLPTGTTGSFYLNHLGNWVVQTKGPNNLAVTVTTASVVLNNYPNQSRININRAVYTITITDEAGFIYTFGNNADAIEFSRGARNGGPSTFPYNEDVVANSWYLTQITSPTGNIVQFTYSRHENTYVQNVAYPSAETISSTSLLGSGGCYLSQQTTASYGGQVISPVYLTGIKARSFNVNFVISKSAQKIYQYKNNVFINTNFNYGDLEVNDMTSTGNYIPTISYWYELDSIYVNDFNNVNREKYLFVYSHDTTSRLFLGEFRKLNLTATGADQVYHFNYNCIPLPPYNAMQQDQWGYYNGNPFPATVTVSSSLLNYFAMNNYYAQAGILQSVIYPTGGSTTFNWEPNDYNYVLQKSGDAINLVNTTGQGGGVRIQSIVSSDNNGNSYTKSYVYKKITNGTAGVSSGVLSGYNKIVYNISLANPALVNLSFLNYDDYSKCLDYSNGRDVVYSEVQENLPDGSYRLFDYSNSDNSQYMDEVPINVYSDAYNISIATGGYITSTLTSSYSYPLLSSSSRDLERGELLMERDYTSANVLLKQIQYTYTSDPTRFNNYVRSYDNYSVTASNGNNFTQERYFQAVKYYTYFPYLASKATTLYDQTGANPVTNTETYTYDAYRNRKSETFTSSDGSSNALDYNYPTDAITGLSSGAQAAQTFMVSANMTNVPLEKIIYKNGVQTGHERIDYGIFTGTNGNFAKPAVFNKSVSTLALEPRISYNAYDGYGHILDEQKTGDMHHVYLWGYNGSYPVAEIKGSSYSTVSGYVMQSTLDNPSSDAAMRTALGAIRTGLAGSVAQVTSYTYTPGTGMTSETDPTGKIGYFTYDGLNRLTQEQDINNNVVKEYAYNSTFQGITFQNTAMISTYTRNNCAFEYGGTSVTYTVPVGKWTSTFSQCYANAEAVADVTANGQNYANANGTCIPGVYAFSTISVAVTVTVTNTATGKVWTFGVPAGCNSLFEAYIPQGTYNVKASQNSGTSRWVFQFGGNLVNGSGTTPVSINGAVVNVPGDASIYANPPGGAQ